MTLGIYTDDTCTTISQNIDLSGYIINLYKNYYYYYGEDKGSEIAEMYETAIATWNEKMSVFKICQPCRAYNLYWDQGSGSSNDHRKTRVLNGEENDGEGEETERFNCYDDAGYTNVDQCYKFETHTSLEAAETDDLRIASAQGSILRIKVNGKTYGEGGYTSPPKKSTMLARGGAALFTAVGLAILIFVIQRRLDRHKRRASRELKQKLNEKDAQDSSGTMGFPRRLWSFPWRLPPTPHGTSPVDTVSNMDAHVTPSGSLEIPTLGSSSVDQEIHNCKKEQTSTIFKSLQTKLAKKVTSPPDDGLTPSNTKLADLSKEEKLKAPSTEESTVGGIECANQRVKIPPLIRAISKSENLETLRMPSGKAFYCDQESVTTKIV